jgi:hypothetical protein
MALVRVAEPARQPQEVRSVNSPGADSRADQYEIQGRFVMEVVTRSGRAAAVEFLIRAETVDVLHHQRLSAVLDRRQLRAWLATPGRPLVVGEVAFSLDRMVDRDGRVALTLPDVLVWTLAPNVLKGLQQMI